jgi:hypothetical protein
MKRFRLSTLLLLVVIAALWIALVVQRDRAARREVEAKREVFEAYGLMGKASKGGGAATRNGDGLRSAVESAKAKEGDEE